MQVAEHLRARAKAVAKGDLGQVRAIDADLRRVGYQFQSPLPGTPPAEIAATKRAKQPRPRCEHNAIPERCPECNPELEVK